MAFALIAAGCSTVQEPSPALPTRPSTPVTQPVPAGTPGWQITHAGPPHGIEGFADTTSALPGTPVRLFVSTTARTYTVTAYRMGNYTGSEALQIWKSSPQPGGVQAGYVVQNPTSTVVAPWHPTLTLDTRDWPAGDYLLRLDGDNNTQQFVPLTIRAPSNKGRIVIVNAVTTWQAYNRWGGYSLYDSPSGSKARRSRAVSFDRPYQSQTMQGAGDFLYFELPFVLFAERSGHRLGYATDVDLATDPHLLDGAAAVITLSHDEYWTASMRNNVVTARDNGVNVAFLGGNDAYRHMRFGDSPVGPNRLEIDYKSFTEDPIHTTDPLAATQEWRSPPNPRPESAMLGNYYQCNPVQADLVVAAPDNWLLHGLVSAGQHLPRMVGDEYNAIDLDVPTPRPIESLFHSPVTCQHRSGFADVSYYAASSGAAVFAAGTEYWICGLDPYCTRANSPGDTTRRVMRAITTRLLDAYAAGPAGAKHPPADNLVALGLTKIPAPARPQLPVATVGG
ncbi:N,N-dimethylformamidase beta subunit family domain-containing protein [Skermania sp. ID1734]|uniref:N,N-dimethylformamidase beta subunit family domain-containing protein n=1 Tax=Skermania sp. ID1734 TaxID=2597516 RepID=UPI0021044605|nr:N,N-dimethylformamidase beta subunit family domain-containing protein [Skermania sp. ID1734]